MAMRRLILLPLLLGLAGCPGVAPIDIQTACPPLRAWSAADQKALADALAPIPESSPLWALEKDWGQMRDAIRACQKR
jgi:hypothetical protein